MSRKIIGITVGSQLPKPDFAQNDPTKGDYIKNKPDIADLQSKESAIYKQPEAPEDAPEGALWIDTDEESGSSGGSGVSSWNDLTDKPFGEVYSDTLTWDGDKTDREILYDYFVKISDANVTKADLANGYTIEYVDSGVSSSVTIPDDALVLDEGGALHVYTNDPTNSLSPIIIIIPESIDAALAGVYAADFSPVEIYLRASKFTIPNYTGFPVTKKIDKKYLPDTMPEVTAEDNGKFLRVVDGAWAAVSVPNAEEASF